MTRLACDAWLLPTDDRWRISKSFAPAIGVEPDTCLDRPPWEGTRVQPYEAWAEGKPWIWLGLVGKDFQTASWYAECGEAFVAQASAALREQLIPLDRRPVLAVNVLGTGEGGMAADKGEIHRALLPVLERAAHDHDADVILVTWGRRAYAAAQRERRRHLSREYGGEHHKLWDLGEEHEALIHQARQLADQARRHNLVVFVGAGVSAGVGFPVWQQLLDDLAKEAGLVDGDVEQLRRLDLRDQAALLGRRFAMVNKQLGSMVSKRFSSTRYSLVHGLLASLGARENVTTNYDQLFEIAVQANQESLAVLPYEAVHPQQRWLLKLHGSIDHGEDIVITRADYLGVPSRRGALFGIVQAMLLTRHMLFIGYSLSDEDFHAVMHDVSSARSESGGNDASGTALTLFTDTIFQDLWSPQLNVVPVAPAANDPTKEEVGAAARQLAIFLDLVCFQAADLSAFLLDESYADMLDNDDEHALHDALVELRGRMESSESGPGWERVARLLEEFEDGASQVSESRPS